MTGTPGNVVLRHIRDLAAAEKGTPLGDRQLLERFAARREEAAFAALVRRHGPLVLGVCRRVLHDPHDAEDAFQATFLALARQAGSVGRRASLGTWLYRVAYRTALRARKQSSRRRRCERGAPGRPPADPLAEVTGRELLTLLDEALHELPERLRAPLVLCYLAGKARDEAARELGWSLGTLKRRLEQGRVGLRARLARRGVELAVLLVAGAGGAAVSAARANATARAALLTAAGGPAAASARVLDLARQALRPAAAGPRKAAGVILLSAALFVAAGLLALRAPATVGDDPPPAPGAAAGAEARPGGPPAAERPQMIVVGRVVDARDNPVPRAEVGALNSSCRAGADRILEMSQIGLPGGLEWGLLQRARADGEGRYRLRLPRTETGAEIALVGLAPGHAVGWEPVETKNVPAEVVLRLPEEEPVRGRLIDLQGQPAAGVRVHLLKAAREAGGRVTGVCLYQPAEELPFWPAPVTTDKEGRFVLRGVNRTMSLAARARDDRFALSDLLIEPGRNEEVRQALAPARIIEGRVIKEDTREPFPGVSVQVTAADLHAPHHYNSVTVRTDREGRFRMSHFAADDYSLRTDIVPDAPYFAINRIEFSWPDKVKTRHSLEVVLPYGVLQAGKVVDAATGRPVAGAEVMYLPQTYNNPALKDKNAERPWSHQMGIAATKEDGSFRVPVLPGPGHIAISAPGYVSYVRTRKEIFGHEPLWGFWAAGAFVKIDVKPGARPAEVTAKLQPARPFRGRVVDGTGRPAARARLAVRTLSADPHRESGIHEEVVEGRPRTGPTIAVKDGAFELSARDPTEAYRVFVLDDDNRRGATALLPAKYPDDKPIAVRWQPCGSASVRFMAEGKPAADYEALLWVREALESGAGEMRTAAPFSDTVKAGGDGKVTLDQLIPGVRYLLLRPDGKGLSEFVAEPGRKLDLGDIAVGPMK